MLARNRSIRPTSSVISLIAGVGSSPLEDRRISHPCDSSYGPRKFKQQVAVVAASFFGRRKFPVDMRARGCDPDTCGKCVDSPANGAAEWTINERCQVLPHPFRQLADSRMGQTEFIAQFSQRLTLE